MKIPVELFTAVTGWTSTGSFLPTPVLNAHPEFIAENLASSVIFHIPAGSQGKSFQKTVTVSTVGYPEMVFSIWSRGKQGDSFEKYTDFSYKVSFDNGAHEYYVPTWRGFNDVTIEAAGTTVSTLIFTVLHNDEDWIVLSGMYAVADENPLDIVLAVQDGLARSATAIYPSGFLTGATVSAVAGATQVTFSGNLDFLGRYRLIRFGTETHCIEQWAEGTAKFKKTWSGDAVVSNQTNTPVYLLFPISWSWGETDLLLPVMALNAMQPEPILRTSGVQRVTDTFDVTGSFKDRKEDMLLNFPLMIDVEAQEWEMLARVNRIVRAFLGQGYLWINGRKHDFVFEIPAVEVDPESVNETLPKTQYMLDVVARERTESRLSVARYVNYNATWTIVEPGGALPPYGS